MGVTYGGTIPLPFVSQAINGFNPTAQNFIAATVAPAITVSAKDGTLPVMKRSATMARLENTKRAPGTLFARGDMQTGGIEYKCLDYGFEHLMPVETMAQFANEFEFDMAAAMQARGELFAGREKRAADLLFSTGTWTGDALYTDASSAPWTEVTSDIVLPITNAIDKVRAGTGLKANAIIMSNGNFISALANEKIKAMMSGIVVATQDVVASYLAKIFGVEKVIVGDAVYNSANEVVETVSSDTVTASDVWSSNYVMVARVANSSNPTEPGVARLVNFAGQPGTDMSIEKYYENQRKAWIYQTTLCEDEVVIDSAYGHLVKVN